MSGGLLTSLDLQLPHRAQPVALGAEVMSKLDERRHQLWRSSSDGCRPVSPVSTTTSGGNDSDDGALDTASEWPSSPDTEHCQTPCLRRSSSKDASAALLRRSALSTGLLPDTPALLKDGSALSIPPRRARSLPAVLMPPMEAGPRSCGSRGVPVEMARLMVPRRPDEYVECCRFARSFSEELFFGYTVPEGAMLEARDMPIKALSEGLLGGRLGPSGAEGARGQPIDEEEAAPRKPAPFSALKEGMGCEGKILRRVAAGLLLDIGAVRPGLLRKSMLQGLSSNLLKQGEHIAGLEIESIDKKKRSFTLRWRPLRDDEGLFGEFEHEDIEARIAKWANVDLTKEDGGDNRAFSGRMSAPSFGLGFFDHATQVRTTRMEAFCDRQFASAVALPSSASEHEL